MKAKIKAKDVIIENCKLYGISYSELISENRKEFLVKIRAKIAKVLRDEFGMSYPDIGKLLKRDHTTIINLVKKRNKEIIRCSYYTNKSFKKECFFCGKIFIAKNKNQKYCSVKCSRKLPKTKNFNFKKTCKYCEKTFYTNISHKVFCSKSCKSKKRTITTKPILREYFFERANFQCEKCGKSDTLLELHHKIPIYKGGEDSRDNIIVLCVMCHWKEHLDMAQGVFTKVKNVSQND